MPTEIKLPTGWFAAGNKPHDYEMGLERSVVHSGTGSGFVRSVGENPGGFATLMQAFKARDYAGSRLRMSAWCKAWSVHGWAGLWLRVDGDTEKNLVLDNMQERPIKDSIDWTRFELVVDVPPQGSVISFGMLLNGQGHVWVDDFQFEKVGPEVPVSSTYSNPKITTSSTLEWPDHPQNLDFEG